MSIRRVVFACLYFRFGVDFLFLELFVFLGVGLGRYGLLRSLFFFDFFGYRSAVGS